MATNKDARNVAVPDPELFRIIVDEIEKKWGGLENFTHFVQTQLPGRLRAAKKAFYEKGAADANQTMTVLFG